MPPDASGRPDHGVAGPATVIPALLLVGCGRMGSALLSGWEAEGLAASVIIEPSASGTPIGPHLRVTDARDVPADIRPAAVILAIKPQMADQAMAAIAPLIGDAVVLSIMAGRTLDGLRSALPGAAGIVRAMPNMPAAIGRGISVAVAEPGVSQARRDLCDRLLRAAGSVAWVEDEALLDPVTAVSGSGPAYVFLLAELLEAAGRAQGLPEALARQLARETVSGAGALLAASPEDAADLRRAVTSPGGTTQAALAVLMADAAWPRAMTEAVRAATERSRALAS
ncbi:pyrroline-5-carboxylate reductase [Lichenicola sp.]|uniref:pyrroline-5-carboxylate reductase n=1 Tax=Lichenicola sp. TaxID=2804529 RepID=UPI003B007789